MSAPPPQLADVVAFWKDAGPAAWYRKDEVFDRSLVERFGALHGQAAEGALPPSDTAEGALAVLLLLDQFSRNMFRDTPRMFAQDESAREMARRAIASGFDHAVDPQLRQFFYLPFMHSESLPDQDLCIRLIYGPPDRGNLPYAREHQRIIRRFGRFPHRNAVLGRHTTPAEERFLAEGGFAG